MLDYSVHLFGIQLLVGLHLQYIYVFVCFQVDVHHHLLLFLLLLLSWCISMWVLQRRLQAWHAYYSHFSGLVWTNTLLDIIFMQKYILKWQINPSFYCGDNFCIYMASTITVMILIWVFDHVWDLVFFTRTHTHRNLVINGPTWLMNAISVYDYNVLFAQVSVKKQNAAIKPRKTRPLWFIVGFSTIKLYILSCQYGLLASFWATRRWSINIY